MNDDAKAYIAYLGFLAFILACLTVCFVAYRITGGTWP